MSEKYLIEELKSLAGIIKGAEVCELPSGLVIVIKGKEKVQLKPME